MNRFPTGRFSILWLVWLPFISGCNADPVRVMTYNASLHASGQGELAKRLATGTDPQAKAVADIITKLDPDILLLNEFDYDEEGHALKAFQTNHLRSPYPHHFLAPSNTGLPSGLDLNQDGKIEGGGDAFGFGMYPGQYGMVLLSKYPIRHDEVRTFQRFRWSDMPDNLLPSEFYGPEASAKLRLSSKNHWDIPVELPDGRILHILASHPTPPVFDGPEDRNGRRNHDEIRFWSDYLSNASYITDDAGTSGGLGTNTSFAILGDLNADPLDGGSRSDAIRNLIAHPRVRDIKPRNPKAAAAAKAQAGPNALQKGDPALDTADFSEDRGPGNLRVDYVLPSRDLHVSASGVHWPEPDTKAPSDHMPVWIDVLPK